MKRNLVFLQVVTEWRKAAWNMFVYIRLSPVQIMQDLKQNGSHWNRNKSKKTLKDLPLIANNKPVLLVLGNEENGISKDVIENCDELIRIEGKEHLYYGNTIRTAVESLNVAQAATLFL